MEDGSVYAAPRTITDIPDCFFYHAMDIPGHGSVGGMYDLRENVQAYLGGVSVRGKRVLEVGTASGFLCFHMEREGAEVVAYDLSPSDDWDIVPFARRNQARLMQERKEEIERLNNAFWFAHAAHQSRARAVYGTAYAIPSAIGTVDVCTFGCVLRHLRDPFRALEQALRLTSQTVIITENMPWGWTQRMLRKMPNEMAINAIVPPMHTLIDSVLSPQMIFVPEHHARNADVWTWWDLSPGFVKRALGVLGFERTRLTYHFQIFNGIKIVLYTVVGQRTVAMKQPG